MDWELEAVKARLKVAKLKAKNRELKERLADYEDNGWIDDLEAEVLHLNALAESLKASIEAKDAEIAKLNARIAEVEAENERLNGVIDRTVNAWESRCIEKYGEIERLNAHIAELEELVDELVDSGDNLFDSLNTIAWKHEWLDKWWELSNRIRKERE